MQHLVLSLLFFLIAIPVCSDVSLWPAFTFPAWLVVLTIFSCAHLPSKKCLFMSSSHSLIGLWCVCVWFTIEFWEFFIHSRYFLLVCYLSFFVLIFVCWAWWWTFIKVWSDARICMFSVLSEVREQLGQRRECLLRSRASLPQHGNSNGAGAGCSWNLPVLPHRECHCGRLVGNQWSLTGWEILADLAYYRAVLFSLNRLYTQQSESSMRASTCLAHSI